MRTLLKIVKYMYQYLKGDESTAYTDKLTDSVNSLIGKSKLARMQECKKIQRYF